MITKNSLLEDIISYNPSLTTLAERLGFPEDSGTLTIDEVSKKSCNNPDFIVEIFKAHSNKNHFPFKELKIFSLSYLINYLRKTHRQYIYKLLPEIEQSITQLIQKFGLSHPNLVSLTLIFLKYKNDLEKHIQEEEKMLFPYIENLLKAKQHGSQYLNPIFKSYSINHFISLHHENEISLPAIRKTILENSQITSLPMPYRIFLIQLEFFEQDLITHSKVEDEVLIPKSLVLENLLK